MDTGIFDNGLVGAIGATIWFFQRYAQLEADYSSQMPRAARARVLALMLAATAIPIASSLVFVVVISMLAGPSLLGFDGPTWYVGALMPMLTLVLLVECAILWYRMCAQRDMTAGFRVPVETGLPRREGASPLDRRRAASGQTL